MAKLQEQSPDRGAAQYRSELRATVRGLWSSATDDVQAFESFMADIRRSFTWAYTQGSKDVGIQPSDWTVAERQWLEQHIREELSYIDGFIDAIAAGSKANGGKLSAFNPRIELWTQRYLEVYTQGQLTAKTDPKLRWIRTALESCPSCLALEGKVKRKSQWDAAGLYPQAPVLACMRSAAGPTVCKCHFEVTQDPCSPGPLPRI